MKSDAETQGSDAIASKDLLGGWIETAKQTATRSDADCQGFVWAWGMHYASDEETDELKPCGFKISYQVWRAVAHSYDAKNWTHWKRTGLTLPNPPNADISHANEH